LVSCWLTHSFIDDFKKAYPQAKVIGVEPLKDKKGVPKLDGGMSLSPEAQKCLLISLLVVYGVDPSETKYGFEDEVSYSPV